MELPKRDSRDIHDKEPPLPTEAHKSRSGSRNILGERKLPSQEEDVIMSDENWTYETEEDTSISDYYSTDATQSSDTTTRHPSSGLAPSASDLQQKYLAGPRRHEGRLGYNRMVEDAVFFARANQQYQQNLREVIRENAINAQRDPSGAAEKRKSFLRAKADAASKASKDPDVFWDGPRGNIGGRKAS